MTWRKSYERWKQTEHLDLELKERLIELEGDEQALEDCFYKDLEFGTGGMRGEIGAGTNRMNIYTVRKASAGFAAYISSKVRKRKNGALSLLMIPAISLRSSRWKRQKHLRHKASKHTCLMSFARRQSCHSLLDS